MTGPELYLVTGAFVAFFGIGWLVGMKMGAPPPCKHSTRTTTFYGMDDLRDLFSGRITVEEYRKRPDSKIVSKCVDCGEIL